MPRRLTYHPDPDLPVAWTPDGKSVLFRSTRTSYGRFTRLYTVPLAGGLPAEVPLPMAEEGSYSPDGTRLAYVPFTNTRASRGPISPGRGTAAAACRLSGSPICQNSAVEKIPHTASNDFNPMWLGSPRLFPLRPRRQRHAVRL